MSADRRIVTTLDSKVTDWVARAKIIPPQYSAVRRVITLLQQAEQCFAAVLNGHSRSDQMLAAVLRRTRPRSRIVIADCSWKGQSSRLDGPVRRMGLRLIDSPRVVYCVLSSDEKLLFPHTWGVDSERVFLTHWFHTLTQEELAAPTRDDGYVFAGGDSLRDYRPLIELSRRLSLPVRVATRIEPSSALPLNVTMGPVSEDEYVDLMRRSSVVVVPLQPTRERSAGQTSYLNAMAMGKLVIVTEGTGVRDYVDHGITGLIVPPGDTEALGSALQWALSPSNCSEVEKISAEAQVQVRSRFGPDNYVSSLLRVIDELPD
jgi:Glycosyl transferases group 1